MLERTRNVSTELHYCRERSGHAMIRLRFILALIASVSFGVAQGGITLTTLHSFTGSDGANPAGGLVQGTDGNLYGTTSDNSITTNFGTVFRITPGGVFSNQYNLDGASDGSEPQLGLTLGSDGKFYGTSAYHGPSGWGTIFQLTESGDFTVLSAPNSFTGSPGSLLVQVPDGNFYLLGNFGFGAGLGSLLGMSPDGTVNSLATFYGTNGFTGWSFSRDVLIQGADGKLYGATQFGGPEFAGEFVNPAYGTVFELGADGSLNTLFSFDGTNGAYVTALIQGKDGNLYGTTDEGGPAFVDATFGGSGGFGTIFMLSTNGDFTTLAIFNGTNGNGPNSLIQARDGNFYGTTQAGGSNSQGTIFRLTSDGTLSTLFSFNGTNGAAPVYSTLLEIGDSQFYGTTYRGGTSNLGTIFRFSTTLSPQLAFTRVGANLILSWPTNASGFTLQSATNLVAPTIWTAVSAAHVVVNGLNTVTNPISGMQKLYRLVQ
jgi:uncharacterized repeat protein (TIGR03803 family)